MPFIRIETSSAITPEQKERLTANLGEAISVVPGKSERWLMLDLCGERCMAFAGKIGDCAMITVKLFGSASNESYDALTARVTEIAARELSLPADRIYVQYEEVFHWGVGGSNF